MPSTLLSAAKIKAAKDLTVEDVPVPEWVELFDFGQMNAEESTLFTKELGEVNAKQGSSMGMYLMLIHSARDESDKRIFTVEDLPELMKKNIDVLNRLQVIALRLNKMGVADQAALKKALSVAPTGATPTP